MSDESVNGDGPEVDEDETPEALRWIPADDPRVVADPENFTTPNERSGHNLVARRCQGVTKTGPTKGARCRGPAQVVEEDGRLVCAHHSTKKAGEKDRPKRGGSLRDRLRSRADESYDELEDELLGLAQSAMTSKVVTCKGCRRKTTVEVADASVRLRAIEAILDRVGAAKPTAAAKNDDQFEGRSMTLEEIQRMETSDLVKYHDWLLARDADALERMMQTKRDYAATRAEYGSSKVVQMGFRSGSDDQTLRRLRDELNELFPPESIAAA